MSEPPFYVTTAIPYVNARPHLGFAMELVQADVLARYHRRRGADVRSCTGTDENSLKNVHAAEAEGIEPATLVERHAAAYRALAGPLGLSFDDFIRTSTDPRHRAAANSLWRACRARGDIYRKAYRGRYCVGCEQFYTEAELVDDRCPEHGTVPEWIEEENDFFRLSRYQGVLLDRLRSGALRVWPEHHHAEIVEFVAGGLLDFSISRSRQRARGWGIAVPDEPDRVMYVWFDALGNYVSALGYGSTPEPDLFQRYWRSKGRRVHVIGKGITRFHAVYWPAMLESAGLPWPTDIVVHGYLTVEGRKIGKSLGNAIDPVEIVNTFGTDPVRHYLTRHVSAVKDGDFDPARVQAVRDAELADQLGNLVQRTIAMTERYFDGRVPSPHDAAYGDDERRLQALGLELRAEVDRAMASFRHDEAARAIGAVIEAANRYLVVAAPWQLAKARRAPAVEARLATSIYVVLEVLRLVVDELHPFVPSTAAAIEARLGRVPSPRRAPLRWGDTAPGTAVLGGPPLFPKAGAEARP